MTGKESEAPDKVRIVGVYAVTEKEDAYLIEVLVDAKPSEFDAGEFGQRNACLPKDRWQVAWDEHYLNDSGSAVIGDYFDKPFDDSESTRVAFYLFEVDFERPLLTPFGPISLPRATPIPERLREAVHFEEPD